MVAYWGKAGRRSAARSALVEAAAQFQKALDQLALLPDVQALRQVEFAAERVIVGLPIGNVQELGGGTQLLPQTIAGGSRSRMAMWRRGYHCCAAVPPLTALPGPRCRRIISRSSPRHVRSQDALKRHRSCWTMLCR